jgi:hypothetical protein
VAEAAVGGRSGGPTAWAPSGRAAIGGPGHHLDELSGTFDLRTDRPLPVPHTTTLEITITGGTGRFADASGTAASTTHV